MYIDSRINVVLGDCKLTGLLSFVNCYIGYCSEQMQKDTAVGILKFLHCQKELKRRSIEMACDLKGLKIILK